LFPFELNLMLANTWLYGDRGTVDGTDVVQTIASIMCSIAHSNSAGLICGAKRSVE